VPAGVDPVGFRALFDATNAAIHWPWAGVYDPLGSPGAVRFVPASGHVAGSFAAMDLAVGAFRSAANSQLEWIVSLQSDVDHATAAVYNDAQVNCIRALPNRGLRIFGARTLSSDPNWLYVPVRRLVSMIESAILSAMQWAVFEPNTATTRALIRRSCTTFLQSLWERGAFAGTSAAQAYQVICDGSNNPVATQALGQLFVDIALAPVRPSEYIVFRVGQQHGVMEVFEGSAA
jgi:phage tail sheath protein FI